MVSAVTSGYSALTRITGHPLVFARQLAYRLDLKSKKFVSITLGLNILYFVTGMQQVLQIVFQVGDSKGISVT